MANKLIVAPAPHVQTAQSTTRIMRDVVIALMPALVVSTVVFGLDVLRVTALSVVSCVVIEYLIQKFMVRGATTVGNWSAVVTGVLLAFNLPASIPWWIVVMGAFVAIAVAKMTFGGLGKNPFNPALVGRVFLLIAYPVQMTTWPLPVNGSFDVLSAASGVAPDRTSNEPFTCRRCCWATSPVRWARWPLRPCCADSSTCCGGA